MWTKGWVQSLSEAELRVAVLMPLFQAMGYLDVTQNHGSQELGKDFVMWKRDPLHGRLNYAVVAKATRITGRAVGKSSAMEVAFQVAQAFGSTYLDPRTSAPQHVHHVMVVSSHEIKQESITAIRSGLIPLDHADRVTYVDGNHLWELIVDHMPRAALAEFKHASRSLQSLDENYRVTANVRDGQLGVQIEPRNPSAPPLGVAFNLPETPDGELARQALEGLIKTGAPAEINADWVEVRAPETIRSLLLPVPAGTVRIESVPNASTVIRLRIECETASGGVDAIPGLEFNVLRGGTEEATVSNAHQNLPWALQLELERFTHRAKLKFETHHGSHSVYRVLQVARLINAIAGGGTLRLVDEDSGFAFIEQVLSRAAIEPTGEPFIELLEMMMEIQRATRVALVVPESDLDREDVQMVRRVHRAVTTGKLTGLFPGFTATMTPAGITQLLATNTKALAIALASDEDETVEFFGNRLSLGSRVTTLQGFGVNESTRAGLTATLAAPAPTEPIVVQFVPVDDRVKCEIAYLRWLPIEEIESLERRFNMSLAEQPGGLKRSVKLYAAGPPVI